MVGFGQLFGFETPEQKRIREQVEAQRAARVAGYTPEQKSWALQQSMNPMSTAMDETLRYGSPRPIAGESMWNNISRKVGALPAYPVKAINDLSYNTGNLMLQGGKALANTAAELLTPQDVVAAERKARQTPVTPAAPPQPGPYTAAAGTANPTQVPGKPQSGADMFGRDSPAYSTVLGFGRFGQPPKPLTTMGLGEVVQFGRSVLIPNSRAAGIGRDSRGLIGSSATGAYQFTGETLERLGPKVLGANWQNERYSPENQDRLAEALFNESKGGDLTKVWAGLKNNTPGAYKDVPWEGMRRLIMKKESIPGGGESGTGRLLAEYDPSYSEGAIASLEEGLQAANKPFGVEEDYVAPPPMPKAEHAPRTDWTAADAALQDMRPEEIMESDKRKMIKTQLWKGAAQAMMSLPEGAGLGRVLAALGGGMLGGKMVGQEEVQKRMDKFDDKMSQWKSALYRGEVGKAETLSREIGQEVQTNNQYALTQYRTDMEEFRRNNETKVGPEGVTMTYLKDGKRISKFIPNAGANILATRIKQAGIEVGMGDSTNAFNLAESKAALTVAMHAAKIAAQNGDSSGLVMVPMAASQLAVGGGRAREVLGEQAYTTAEQGFRESVKGQPEMADPFSKEYKTALNKYLEGAIVAMVTSGKYPDLEERLLGTSTGEFHRLRTQSRIKRATGQTEMKSVSPAELFEETTEG